MSKKHYEFFCNKIALGPMVRAGRTSLRVLALNYGADLAYTEEIIDTRFLLSKRFVNEALGTIDYIIEDEVVLRVAKEELSKCILQIGTNSAEKALKVYHMVEKDVAGIDINMGCPKPFSIYNGMGAALLSNSENVKEILSALCEVSRIPISCKIRVLDKNEKTLEFVKMVERCGISMIGVHGRRRNERPNDPNRCDEIREIARYASVPIFANGNSDKICCYEDILKFQNNCETKGVILSRKALSNPSIFCKKSGILSMQCEIENFLDKCCEYDENFKTTKYVVQRILGSAQEFDAKGKATVAASNNLEICQIWSKEKKYWECKKLQNINKKIENDNLIINEKQNFFKVVDGVNVAEGLTFAPKKLTLNAGSGTPKCVLNSFCDENKIKRPNYEIIKRKIDGRFQATISVAGKNFCSTVAQPNKKMAQQVAALAALIGLNQRNKLTGKYEGE